MNTNDLAARVQAFRQGYLNSPVGRAHLQQELDEPKEVQAVFEALCQRKKAGEDITEDGLRLLLPHHNTKNNRDRGARISSWPCVTKNVRTWFEAANWKLPDEWPATVDWLLAICNAGRIEDWTSWRSLAHESYQKGFACGFITPIVHCLNGKLPVINAKVVKTYLAIAATLGLDTKISAALDEYPENGMRLIQLVEQLGDIGISCLQEFDMFCHWNVTKRLGGGGEIVAPPEPPPNNPTPKQALSLVSEELLLAQHDTKHPDRFEATLAAAFKAMGFVTEHIGGAGEADVVATALIGEDTFSIVLDAKTCPEGGTRGNMSFDPLKKHQEHHEADFAIVVAPAFAQGDTVAHADKHGVGLLTTDCLVELVEEAETHGVSLYALKSVLGKPGMIKVEPAQYRGIHQDLVHAALAVLRVFEEHQRVEDSSSPLDPGSVYWILKGTGSSFPHAHIDRAIQFLATPLLGVLEQRDHGYVLTLPAGKVATRIRGISKAFAVSNG